MGVAARKYVKRHLRRTVKSCASNSIYKEKWTPDRKDFVGKFSDSGRVVGKFNKSNARRDICSLNGCIDVLFIKVHLCQIWQVCC